MDVDTPLKKVYGGFCTHIMIIVPPDLCPQFAAIRNIHTIPLLTPPHITLVSPFLSIDNFDYAEQQLIPAMKSIAPFKIRCEAFGYFAKKENVLWMEPISDPPNAIIDLHKALVNVFPSCDHLSKKSPKGFQAHLSMGFFDQLDDLQNHIEKYSKEWVPAEFLVKEIYIINRLSSDVPYDVRKVIPLGTEISPPLYPPIPVQSDHFILRTIICNGFPVDMKPEELEKLFQEFSPEKVEIKYNKFGVSLQTAKILFKERKWRQEVLNSIDSLEYNGTLIHVKPAN